MPKQIQRLSHLQTLTNFVVGEHSGYDIKELEKLNHLRETLCISQLENVTDRADAVEANLRDKTHLEALHMRYGYKGTTDGSIVEKDVLEVLEPNSNLNSLIIEDYRGTGFPHWLGDCYLLNLVSLELNRCGFCSRLPPLGKLPSLKELSISECYGIEIIGEEFYGYNSSTVPFASLESLKFDNMYGWNECSSLEKLYVGDYDGENLEWPSFDLRSCNSLCTLSISGWCSSSLPFALNLFTNLHSLDLYDCRQLKLFPQRGLPSSLSTLRINKFPELIALREEWGLFELNSLKEFKVSDDFENVESFPEENLLPPTLKSLRLENCSKLRIINYKGLLNLKSLRLLH
ncbi:putative disease resistance RPP13-like protein 1 [Medicago truncatula]|uniref:putative disease resistance RPP13-like protein 1 n=1 Tax=Medicago truncatula TaxID=3880 RepID=UPI000D2F1FAE|nr:putative disease resistance RPP13-like protein 1 [Medicago truncatula]